MKALPIVFATTALLFNSGTQAAGDLSRASPQEIVIEMGTSGDRMYFKPNHLDLETGKAYKIVLRNLDETKHEFTGHEFFEKLFTRKVQITDLSGDLVAEIKGNVREIEVGPKREVEWFIVPIQTGENIPMECALEGHKQAGMVGTVTIK
ncbi:MAG: biphenyl 2,3-dioxygenase [Proteobacteria bacterium]|nr:biphenyl 2,3-dioxygenase [Pseudomonadota bacterium]